jgi:hypothetical protein
LAWEHEFCTSNTENIKSWLCKFQKENGTPLLITHICFNVINNEQTGIQVYLMSDCSGQQIVILTTIWWWQKLGRDWQRVNNQSQEIKRGKG